MFTNLTDVLDGLPTDVEAAPFNSPYLRDDSLSLLHAMDRVLGSGIDTEIFDSPSNSDDEDETKVGSGQLMNIANTLHRNSLCHLQKRLLC